MDDEKCEIFRMIANDVEMSLRTNLAIRSKAIPMIERNHSERGRQSSTRLDFNSSSSVFISACRSEKISATCGSNLSYYAGNFCGILIHNSLYFCLKGKLFVKTSTSSSSESLAVTTYNESTNEIGH